MENKIILIIVKEEYTTIAS